METRVSVVGCVKERQEKLIQLKKGKMEMLYEISCYCSQCSVSSNGFLRHFAVEREIKEEQ